MRASSSSSRSVRWSPKARRSSSQPAVCRCCCSPRECPFVIDGALVLNGIVVVAKAAEMALALRRLHRIDGQPPRDLRQEHQADRVEQPCGRAGDRAI